MIGEDILKVIESNLVDKNECIRIKNWFIRNEPRLIEWSARMKQQQINSLGVSIPAPMSEVLESRFMLCVMAGTMSAMMHNTRIVGNELDIDEFKTIFDGNPGEIWSAWISGDLPDKYYDSSFVGSSVSVGNLGQYWNKAIENHNLKMKKNEEAIAVTNMMELVGNEAESTRNKKVNSSKKISVDI